MKQRISSLLFTVAISAAGVAAHAATPRQFDEQDRQEVKAVFLRQAAAATAHDIAAFERVFAPTPAGQPDPVTFVARAYQFWGKTALIEHFKETFKGVWKFEPDAERVRVVPLTPDTAEIYAPTQVTSGSSIETGDGEDSSLSRLRNCGPHVRGMAHRGDRSGTSPVV